jgi:hypothetical protein
MESSGLRTGAMPAIDLGSARPEEIKEADIPAFQGLLHCQEDAVLPGPLCCTASHQIAQARKRPHSMFSVVVVPRNIVMIKKSE